jgi:hypothetical protein
LDRSKHAALTGQRRDRRLARVVVVGLVEKSDEPEVEELHAGGRQHDVARLQVAVHEPLLMRRVNGVDDLSGDLERFGHRDGVRIRNPLCERLAFQIFHDEVRQARFGADIVQPADVGVRQPGDGCGLALETLAARRF